MKQTAVEWLVDKVIEYQQKDLKISKNFDRLLIANAKEIEKQQMFEYIKNNYCIGHRSLEFHRLEFEQYYDETYKNERDN